MMRSRESTPTTVLFFLIRLMNHAFVDSIIVQGPYDTTVKMNDSTYFNCSTSIRPVDKNAIWFHFPLDGGGQRNYVYDDGRVMTNYKNRFDIEINNSTGEFNLLIKRLEMMDAGKYECRDDPHADIGASAELTVLGSDLTCESDMDPGGVVGPTECENTIKPDYISLSCRVKYNGNNAPRMIWRRVGGSSTLNNTHCVNIDKRVTCNTTRTADLQPIGSAYIHVCEVTTQQYNCSLEINNILYAFANATKREYDTGTDVTCIANASRELDCSYRWYKDNTTEVSSHPLFKPKDPGLYRCQAQCLIRAGSCKFTAMVINVMDTVSVPAAAGQSLWFILFLFPLIIITVIAILCRKCKTPTEPRNISEAITSLKSASEFLVHASEEEKQEYIKKIGQEPSRAFLSDGMMEALRQEHSMFPKKYTSRESKTRLDDCRRPCSTAKEGSKPEDEDIDRLSISQPGYCELTKVAERESCDYTSIGSGKDAT